MYDTGNNNRRIRAFSVLELIVTLMILAILMTALMSLLGQTRYQTEHIHRDLSQRMALQDCLDRLMNDMISHAQDTLRLEVKYRETGFYKTSHLTIDVRNSISESNRNVMRQIEWVAVPRESEDDLVLFRREKTGDKKYDTDFVPQCEHISSFIVELKDRDGEIITQGVPALIDVQVGLYLGSLEVERSELIFRRTFALQRFIYEEDEKS